MEMKNCLLVCFVYSALTRIANQKEVLPNTVTVYPFLYEERGQSEEKLLVISDGYTLKLRKSSVLADSVLVRDVTDKGVVESYVDGKYYEKHLYQDSEKQASLLVEPQARGHYHIVGLLNSTHSIQPLITLERSPGGSFAHIVSRIPKDKGFTDFIKSSEEFVPLERRALDKGSRTLPENFNLELYFISDYSHSEYFKYDKEGHIRYVTLWMLGVSLRLQQLSPPGTITLTVIERISSRWRENFVKMGENGALLARATLDQLSEYIKRDDRMKKADAVFMATKRKVAAKGSSGTMGTQYLGMAYKGAVCGPLRVSLGKDEPQSFSGLHVATHEFGHLLNCDHDGEGDSKLCSHKYGRYIMRPYIGGERHFEWSRCSKQAIKNFLQLKKSLCLNANGNLHAAYLPNNIMEPKSIINGSHYCSAYFANCADVSCIKSAENCIFVCKLSCPKETPALVTIHAPDGMSCDKTNTEKKCKSGFCM